MISQSLLRGRRFAAKFLATVGRHDRGRRRRQSALGFGLPRPEGLEDRTLLAPTATTLAATSITNIGATLNGTVNPNGTSTDAAFQYSTDPNLAPNVVTTFAGSGTAGSADGTGTAAQFNVPLGVAVDPTTGNIFVADTTNNEIREITPAGVVTTLAGSGTAGSVDGTGTAAQFDDPSGVAVDPTTGNVFVADTDNNTIREITPAGVVTTFAGSGTAGSADGTGTAAQFDGPSGVAVDPTTGNVFVADTGNNKIRKITPAGVVTTLAGSGTAGSADGTGASARFSFPYGVAVDPTTSNVFVADKGNNEIREITPAGVVTTLAGSGTAGSVDGPGTVARFDLPSGVAVDPTTGNVFVADTENQKIREITPAGVVTTLAGSGTPGSADGTGTAAQFYYPYGVAVDPTTGTVFVADTYNNKIRELSPPRSPPRPA